MKYLVECLTCRKNVWIALNPYGGGYIGLCPHGEHLAYNRDTISDDLPKWSGRTLRLPQKEAPS